MIDSHCHLNRLDLSAYEGSLERLIDATLQSGITHMLNVGIDLETAQEVIDIAHCFEPVYASVGVHPSDVKEGLPDRATLLALIEQPKVIAIGETGLDYHYVPGGSDLMRDSFALHIELAKTTGKPLIVHTREAQEDTLHLMREGHVETVGGVLHCFTESLAMAESAMDLGFYISFSGIITFKNATALQAVVQALPLERMLIETDSPYLAPMPFRGKTNQPIYLRYVAEKIAELKGIDYETVVAVTSANFNTLFNLV